MVTDPTTRRARNVVLLVIGMVVIPSLLLTALAAVAVRNEEEAAYKRLHVTYEPVTMEVAKHFNAWIDALPSQANAGLSALASAVHPAELPAAAQELLERPFIANAFVIGAHGEVLLPRSAEAASRLPPDLAHTMEGELAAADAERACAVYAHFYEYADPGQRCIFHYAWQLCTAARALPPPPEDAGCRAYASDAIAALGLRLETNDATTQRRAEELLGAIRDPTRSAAPYVVELLALRHAMRLDTTRDDAALRNRQMLRAIAARGALLHQARFIPRTPGEPPLVQSIHVDDTRRVVLTYTAGPLLVGVELMSMGAEPMLNAALHDIDSSATVHLHDTGVLDKLCCNSKAVDAGSAFLRKTDLVWSLDLMLSEADSVSLLGHNRSRLYLWALVLIAGALLAGIAFTVYTVVREARISRLKTDFVSSVSHDLRTPLTSIRMFTEMLTLGRVKNDEEARQCLTIIAQETERLSRLTERILDFSRMEAGHKEYHFEPHEVGGMVSDALAACRPIMEDAKFSVTSEVAPGLPKLRVDRDAMVEVLINLLSNAVKYSPEERRLSVQARAHNGYVELSVRDCGIGIAKHEHKRIFEKFYRVDNRRGTEVSGSGIGLSLVQHIVDAHHGQVFLDSTPGAGSTFTVRLPVRGEPG